MNARFFILAWLALSGCASAPAPPPAVLAGEAAETRIERSIELADEDVNGLEAYDVPIRYNPARCDCPDFEVEVFGRWQRAYIVAPVQTRTRLDDFAESEQSLAELTVRGRMTTTTRRAESRVSYPVFEVEEP